jgi:anaerobic C4-dicarboxylate transporter
MLTENRGTTETKNVLKNPFVYTLLALLVVAIYVVWIFLSRHLADRAYQERIRSQQAEKQRASDQAAIEQLGGSELAIQMLYATPEIGRGETAQVCFGVANAKSVTLEPQSNPVWPSHNLCVDVKPKKTTTYTLTATGADGKAVTQQVTVAVK